MKADKFAAAERRVAEAGPFMVRSRADGVIEVDPAWPDGVGGVVERLTLADDIAAILNRRHKRVRKGGR